MDLQGRRLNQQVAARDEVQPDRPHAFPHLIGKTVMVPEQVQPRLHGGKDFVDLRLAGIAPEGEGEEDDEVFRGHPLAVAPTGAAVVFYAGWPAAIAGIALMGRGRGS